MIEMSAAVYQKCVIEGREGKVTEWLPEKIVSTGRCLRVLTPKGWQGGYRIASVFTDRKKFGELTTPPAKRYAPTREFFTNQEGEI
jgi:hypothetical protein